MTEQQPDNMQEQPEQTMQLNVGAMLRETRESMGLTVEDVVNRLKFAPRQIRALEESSFDQLPEGAFLRGLVRSYARLLQLDEAPLLAALPDAGPQESEPAVRQSVDVPFPGVYSARKSNIIWLVAALLVTLALGLFTWLHGRESIVTNAGMATRTVPLPPVSPASAVPAEPPVPAAPVAVTAEPQPVQPAAAPVDTRPKVKLHVSSGTGPVRMVFDADSWVEVRDRDGNVLMSQINPAGSEQNVDGDPPFALTIGHASGVKLYYKGKQVDLAPDTSAEVAHVTLE